MYFSKRDLLIALTSGVVFCGNANGVNMIVYPDTGAIYASGVTDTSIDWHGVTISDGGIGADGAREYIVYGDFNVNLDDSITAPLDSYRGVRFIVGNNATLAGTFDFSANGTRGRAGGGSGGEGVWGNFGSGGAGGDGYVGDYPSGSGGSGGSAGGWWPAAGGRGADGDITESRNGVSGATASNGPSGSSGGVGGDGFGATGTGGFGGAGGAGGAGGVGGTGGLKGTAGTAGIGGAGGTGGGNGVAGGNGGPGGNGGTGGNGGPGGDGDPGLPGWQGLNPTGTLSLSGGGGGGAGGTSGAGGGGGGGGAGGLGGIGGGGGGGGGGAGGFFTKGGTGGSGGAPGIVTTAHGEGGSGGSGQQNAAGGDGGAGGGAFEVMALGAIQLDDALFQVQGGNSAYGLSSYTGYGGSLGHGGSYPFAPQDGYPGQVLARAGDGAGGGRGGASGWQGTGGNGGLGGANGESGSGAPGAGGTVRLIGAVVHGPAQIDAACGDGTVQGVPTPVVGIYDANLDGRFVLGQNNADAFTGTVNDAQELVMTDYWGRNQGSRSVNPFVGGYYTPNIPGLVDGADIFGMTAMAADDPELASLFGDAPDGAVAAIVLMDQGPAGLGHNWDGFDMLLMVNLTDSPLALPQLGVGMEGGMESLLQGGWQRSSMFGGAGYETLGELAGLGVYALLVPETHTGFCFDTQGYEQASSMFMAFSDALYLTQLTGDLDGDGFVGINDLNIVLGSWNQNVPPADHAADPSGDGFIGIEDLNIVLGNWNAGTPPGTPGSVPEPSTVLLLTLCGTLCLSRSRSL